ncbi:MAG TPA: LPS export ABC transporter periplasmic protein LptC, partial [Thermoanaerobaculia bacterium]|nr:LPS export ABC transporter periplasmic protein LptC [Thermoanaerobaculia bacterium]
MQRTIRTLRVALPIIFFGFLVMIALSWTRNRPAKDRASTEPVVGPRAGEKPRVESKGFEDTQTIAGRVVSRIRARRVVAYSSKWNTLEDVSLTIYRPNSLTYEIVCPQAQFNSETKEADAKGGVRLTSSDGIEIKTAEIHFDGNRLTNRIPVEFRIDRWRGRAGALDLDVGGETLRLFEKLTATMEPAAPGESPMTMDSDEAVFRRRENDVAFAPNVQMTRGADRLNAARILGRFSADRKKLVSLEGAGDILIQLSGNAMPGENLGGKKEITTRRFLSEVGPTGDIVAINAFGDDIVTHAVLEGPPARDLVAKNLRVAFAGRAVSEVRAEHQVVMKELGPAPRELAAERVVIYYDPATRQPTGAMLDTNVRYKDPKNSAAAVRADYDIANDKVLLSTWPGFQATVVADGQTVKAQQIEFSPRAGTAKATG